MKLLYSVLLFLTLLSCTQINNELLIIDPPGFVENKITLSDISDEIFYMPIDNQFPLGIIYSIKAINNSIYISAKDIGVIRYTFEGKSPEIIGRIGRGPGEYLYCMSFAVDSKSGSIYVMNRNNIIETFSFNGNFLKTISLPESEDGFNFDEVEFFNSNLFISQYINMGQAKYNWIIIDTQGTIIKAKRNSIPPFHGRVGAGGGIFKFEDKMSYWNWYNDTIFYILSDMSFKPAFLFAPGDYRFPAKEIQFNSFKQYEDIVSKYMIPNSLIETSRYLVFQYFYNEKQTVAIIDKRSKKTFLTYLETKLEIGGLSRSGGISNDLDGGTAFQPKFYITENGREFIVGLIDPYQIKAHIKSSEFKNSVPKYPERKKQLEKMANSLKETDNPVLMMVRLKN